MTLRILALILAALTLPAAPARGDGYSKCQFQPFKAPGQALVYAAGAYEGRRSTWRLNRDAGPAGIIEVAVNSPDRPVLLLLGAYNPTIWHIGWTEGTQIAAVAAVGYYRQALVGLPEETLVLSRQSGDPCPYFTDPDEPREVEKMKRLSQILTGRDPDGRFGLMSPGRILIGPPIRADQPVLTARAVSRAEFDPEWPLEDFLLTAIRQGHLKPATAREYVQWFEARKKAAGEEAGAIRTPAHLTASVPWNPVWAYLIVDEDFLPVLAEALPKLAAARSFPLTFYLPADLTATQPIGRAILLSLKDGTCLGRNCGDRQLNIKAIKPFEE